MKNIIIVLTRSTIIYLLNFPAHFLYDFFPNKLISLFFPVNESIFQHMKMIFTCFCLFYLLVKLFNKKNKNTMFNCLVSSLTCIAFFLIIYLPIYLNYGENLIFTLILLFLSIIFGEYITSFIKIDNKILNRISLIIIIIILIINAYLTFNPLNNFLFIDPLTHSK